MNLTRKFKTRLFYFLAGIFGPGIGIIALVYLAPLPDRLSLPYSTMLQYRDQTPIYFFLTRDDKWRLPVELNKVDPNYLKALTRFEDKRFYYHPGVDPFAIARAVYLNSSRGKIISGGSTITMQLARILEPRPRTYGSKLMESLRALELETRLSKKEILQAYLQFLPFGKNLEGIESASYAYFGHSSRALSPFEIAYLLSVPQDPNLRYPSKKNLGPRQEAVGQVARRLSQAGIFSPGQVQEILKTPLPESLKPFPRQAPHCAFWLAQKLKNQDLIATTLRKDLQPIAEKTLAAYQKDYAQKGVYNGAIVVIDNRSSQVLALVGNFDFWDQEHQGQVVGFIAPRSPGSALKPFIYALAIDRAMALPGYLVPDLPVRYGGYQPRNYDEQFRGLVKLEDALSQSLNVPFVNLLYQIGIQPFLSFLTDAGISTLSDQPGYYGLSAAIGSMEVNLLELTNLYAALARNGAYLDYQILLNDETRTGLSPANSNNENPRPRQVFSPASAYLTKQALKIRDRPDFPYRAQVVELPPEIHWKTGTSYGNRDAWAIGSNPEFTVGVWLGNFDGAPSSELKGGDLAGPVLFDLLDALSNRSFQANLPAPPPGDLAEIEVCAYSGYLPNRDCPERKKVLAPIKNLPTKTCPYHLRYQVDNDTGYYLPPACRNGRDWTEKVFVVLPASVRRWISDQQLLAPSPPSPLPDCQYFAGQSPPKIVSPQPNAVFFLIPGLEPNRQEIPLEAEGPARENELSWFLNGKFLAKIPAQERAWLLPSPGLHQIRVVDSAGKYDQISIRIIQAD